MRYKITFEYDGTNYGGWQKQKDKLGIQEVLENCVKAFSGETTEVLASGRTDTGVHALEQVAHFDLNKQFEGEVVKNALNFWLGKRNRDLIKEWQKANNNHFLKPFSLQDIVIKNCEIVGEDFHSRFSSKMRYYKYLILNRKADSAIWQNRVWHIRKELDVEKMKEAAKIILGKHDFSSFRDSQCQAKSPIKTMSGCKITRNDEFIVFEFWAKSFLYHMIRNIVGTLRDVGSGKISVEEFEKILEAKDRKRAGEMAPACGLYLMKIEY